MSKFKTVFPMQKPVIGMLHLKGADRADIIARAMREASIMDDAGIDGMIVENYFGTIPDVAAVLDALLPRGLGSKIGINILGDTGKAFRLADEYPVDFLQIDSVAGHLRPDMDEVFASLLDWLRHRSKAAILGGVRFKYMPVNSGRSEEVDLEFGRDRCDAIVVTSDATGQQTNADKITRFKASIGPDVPLIVGAGLTEQNVAAQFSMADGGIIGSWLKDNHRDDGDIHPDHVERFLKAARNTGH